MAFKELEVVPELELIVGTKEEGISETIDELLFSDEPTPELTGTDDLFAPQPVAVISRADRQIIDTLRTSKLC